MSPGTVASVPIPRGAMISDYDIVENNYGINITANTPVSVYAVAYDRYQSAAFTGYPTGLLGANYCLMSRAAPLQGQSGGGSPEFAIVAIVDHTTVTNTPSPTADLDGHSGTNAFTVTLQQGQTYQIKSLNSTDDVTGTMVTSDNPIAVFAGATLANVPDLATQAGNPLLQQQIPVNDWGTHILGLSFAGRTNGDSYRILAASNGTAIFTNGVTAGTKQAGQFLDLIINGPVEFQANQPIQVAHFANGTEWDSLPGNTGDPCEIMLPPTGHYLETNIVFTLGTNAGDFVTNYLNIIVPQSAITNTWVDTNLLSSTSFVAITNSGYYGAQILVTNASATHKVTSTQPVGVEIYGWGNADAYGYYGGIVK